MTIEPYNVPVADERWHVDDVRDDQDLWENHVFLIRGRTAGGQELTLFTGIYVIKQGEDSYYVFDGHVHQTTLLYGHYSRAERQVMHDNDFATAGWQPTEHLPFGSVKVDQQDDRVVWSAGHRSYEDMPPVWRIRGEHGGVDLDLTLTAHVPAFWTYPFEGLASDGVGWYEAYLEAEGRITHRGRDMDFTGYACHERVLLTREHEPHRLMGRGLYWQHLFADRVQCWVMASPSADDFLAHVVVDGETSAASGPGQVSVTDVDTWTDPRSWMELPTAWRIQVDCELGRLDILARAYARAYYLRNEIRGGTHMLYWFTCDAQGSFTTGNGEVIQLIDASYAAHNNREFVLTEPVWRAAET